MITGTVLQRWPTVIITVSSPTGLQSDIEALVDTGFTGYLTLPISTVTALGLPFRSYYTAGLADGSSVRLSLYEAIVLWHGAQRSAFVLATGRQPLLGMSLIYGSRLSLDRADGGAVILDELP